MFEHKVRAAIVLVLLAPFVRAVPAFAHGDKIVPHLVNGFQGGGIGIRTKFDITNLSPVYPISKVTVSFYKTVAGQPFQPWMLTTNLGTASVLTLNLGTFQTIRIETDGVGAFTSGFAVVSSQEGSTIYAEDYEVGITVFYEELNGDHVTETVSVPIGLPTVSFCFPAEIDSAKNIDTGLALVNLTNARNRVAIRLYEAVSPSSANVTQYAHAATLTLDNGSNKKVAQFLDQAGLFPGLTQFKGMAWCSSDGPVAILTLLQTQTSIAFGTNIQYGVQFATLVPSYLDSLRRDTFAYLPQGYALDADLAVVDYFHYENDAYDPDLETPWDLLFQSDAYSAALRYLVPQPGATVAAFGVKTPDQFDALSLADIQDRIESNPLAYLDMSDSSAYLTQGFAFAVKTGLGRYVKVRIRGVLEYLDSSAKDLLLEVYVYK